MRLGFSEKRKGKLPFILSFLVGLIVLAISDFPNSAASRVSLLPERDSLRIRLADHDRALVSETRYLYFHKGVNQIYLNYPGVKIIPESTNIQCVKSPEKINLLQITTSLKHPSSLTWHLYSEQEGGQLVRVSYLVEQLSSDYSYVAEVRGEEDLLFLEGSLTLRNQTGEEFIGAHLTGKEGREWDVNLEIKQKKKLPLFHKFTFRLQKDYVLDREKHGDTVVLQYRFVNWTQNPLLPGRIQVYQRKKEGVTFLGEDRVETVNPGEELKIVIGSVQDIKVERKLIEFSRINLRRDNSGNEEVYDTREKYEIYVKNRQKKDVTLILREYIPFTWDMVKSDPPGYVKEDAHHIRFEISLCPGEEKKIYYHIDRKNLLPRDKVEPLV